MRSFRSDNNAGLCPEALEALAAANDGSHVVGYGDDDVTARAVAAFRNIFGPDTSVWFLGTGTAANTLAIAALTEPWEQIVCHGHSHLNDDESTAPERLTHCPGSTSRYRSAARCADWNVPRRTQPTPRARQKASWSSRALRPQTVTPSAPDSPGDLPTPPAAGAAGDDRPSSIR